jgi:mechanosensitive ion channel-like protein
LGRIVNSVFLTIGAVMLYGLMALWVRVQRLHLARRRDDEAVRTKDAVVEEEGSEVAKSASTVARHSDDRRADSITTGSPRNTPAARRYWTLSNQTTRLLIKIGVAYGSDIALVQRVMLDAIRSNRDVLLDPPPLVYLVAFGDSTLDFEIRAFVGSIDKRLRVQHEINLEVARVLRENGIEIPFPQRDLHIRSAPGLATALRNDQRG